METDVASSRAPFLNAHFDNVSRSEVLDIIDEHVKSGVPGYMVSLNTDICITLEKDAEFRKAHDDATLVLMDSQPLFNLARRYGIPIKEKIAGADLMPVVCEWAATKGYTCFILGGMPGVPAEAARRLQERYKGLQIAGTLSPPYGFEKDEALSAEVVDAVAQVSPDILFLCVGSPKSEKYLHDVISSLNASFCLVVGAAVDFEAGNMRRAPRWMSNHGLEWFYRFLQEPDRLFKRYFVDSWKMLGIIRRYGRRRSL